MNAPAPVATTLAHLLGGSVPIHTSIASTREDQPFLSIFRPTVVCVKGTWKALVLRHARNATCMEYFQFVRLMIWLALTATNEKQ
jgi:hypothetical protein